MNLSVVQDLPLNQDDCFSFTSGITSDRNNDVREPSLSIHLNEEIKLLEEVVANDRNINSLTPENLENVSLDHTTQTKKSEVVSWWLTYDNKNIKEQGSKSVSFSENSRKYNILEIEVAKKKSKETGVEKSTKDFLDEYKLISGGGDKEDILLRKDDSDEGTFIETSNENTKIASQAYRAIIHHEQNAFVSEEDALSSAELVRGKINSDLDEKMHSAAIHMIIRKPLKEISNSMSRIWNHLDYSTLETAMETAETQGTTRDDTPEIEAHDDDLRVSGTAFYGEIQVKENELKNEVPKDKALSSVATNVTRTKGNIDIVEFRRYMELCLASFVTVFHRSDCDEVGGSTKENVEQLFSNQEDEEEKKVNIDPPSEIIDSYVNPNSTTVINKNNTSTHNDEGANEEHESLPHTNYPYVPFSIALMLWTEVILNEKKHNEKDGDIYSKSDLKSVSARREVETKAFEVGMALCSTKLGLFEKRHTGGRKHSDINNIFGKRTLKDAFSFYDEDEYNEEEDEIEIRLFDEKSLLYAWIHHPIINLRLNNPNIDKQQLSNHDANELRLMKDAFGELSNEEVDAKLWRTTFVEKVLTKLVQDSNNGDSEVNVEIPLFLMDEEKDSNNDQGLHAASLLERDRNSSSYLCYLYAVRYLPSFLLNAGSFDPPLKLFTNGDAESSMKALIEEMPDFERVFALMKDTGFICRRMNELGLLEAVMVHLDDTDLMMKSSTHSMHTEPSQDKVMDTYFIEIHKAILSSVQIKLTSISNDIEKAKIIVNRKQHNRETAKWDESECIQRLSSFFEAGKGYHALGVSLGKRQILMSKQVSLKEMESFVDAEMQMYPEALRVYKEALRLLASDKLGQGIIPQELLAGDRINIADQQKIMKKETQKEIELNIADTLSCFAHCKDTKTGNYEEALLLYKEALLLYSKHNGKDHPTVSNTLHNMGSIHVETGNYKVALDWYKEVIATQTVRDAELAKTLQCMGNAEKELGNLDMALKYYSEAWTLILNLNCEDLFLAKLQYEIAMINLLKIKKNPELFASIGKTAIKMQEESMKTRTLYIEKNLYYDDVEKARLQSDIALNLYGLASLHAVEKDYMQAETDLRQALELRLSLQMLSVKDQNADFLKIVQEQKLEISKIRDFIGRLLVHAKRFEDALSLFNEELDIKKKILQNVIQDEDNNKLHATHILAEIDIGHVLSRIGFVYYEKANFKIAIENYKSSLRMFNQLTSTCSSALQDDNRNEGLKDCETKINTNVSLIMYKLGKSYFSMKKSEKSLQCFTDYLKLNQENLLDVSDAYYIVGLIRLQKDEQKEALANFERSIKVKEMLLSSGKLIVQGDSFPIIIPNEIDEQLLKCYKLSYDILKREQSDDRKNVKKNLNIAENALKIGNSLSKKKDYKNALIYYCSAMEYAKSTSKQYILMRDILFRKGLAHKMLGDDDDAIECFTNSIQVMKGFVSFVDVAQGETFFCLGDVWVKTNDKKNALQSYKEALKIFRDKLGDSDIKTADALHEIGILYMENSKDIDHAFKCLTEALKVRKVKLELNNTAIADSLHSLGIIHYTKEEFEQADKCFSEALEIRMSIQQENRDDDVNVKIADCHNCLGEVLLACKKLQNARESFEKSVQTYRSTLGDKNLTGSYLKALKNLGNAFYELDENQEAADCFKEVLRIGNSIVDEDHIEIASTTFHLGLVYGKLDNVDNAMECYIKSLSIYKHHYGEDHVDIIDLMNNMGVIFIKRKSYNEALKCFGQALNSCFKILGEDHQKTGDLNEKMGSVLSHLGKNALSLDHYHDAARITEILLEKHTDGKKMLRETLQRCLDNIIRLTEKTLGSDHEEKCDACLRKGNLHVINKEYNEAETCFKEALRIHTLLFGSEDLSIANDLHNLGSISFEKNDDNLAIEYFEKSLLITKKKLGNESYEVADTFQCLGNAKKRKGDNEAAFECYKESLRIRRFLLRSGGKEDDLAVAGLLNAMGNVEDKRGKYDVALKFYQEVLQIGKKRLGVEHLEISNTLQNIGNVHANILEYDKAMLCYVQALKIRKAKYGNENLAVISLLNSIGAIHDAKGEYDKALSCYEEVLRVNILKCGSRHVDTAKALSNIGSICDALGNTDKAMKYLEESLKILKEELSDDDLRVAETVHNIGVAYDKKCQYDEALLKYKESLRVYKLQLPRDHLSLSKPLHNIAIIYARRQEYSKSVEIFRETLKVKQSCLGMEHIDVADTNFYLGSILFETGEYPEALETYKHCFKIRVIHYGKDDSKVADTLYGLGLVHTQLKEFDNALHCFAECLRVRKLKNGFDSLELALTQFQLGKILHELDNINDAEYCLRNALQVMITKFGKVHSQIGNSLFLLGIIFCEKGEYSQALNFYKESLQISKQCLGENTAEVANIIENIGIAENELGSHASALEHFKTSLKIKSRLFGKSHSDVPTLLHFIGNTLRLMGRYGEAIRFFNESLHIRKQNCSTDELEISNTLNDLGKAYEKIDEISKALDCYEEGHNLRKRVGGNSGWDIAETLYSKGNLHLVRQEQRNALLAFQDAIQIMENLLGLKDRNDSANASDALYNTIDRELRLAQLLACYDETIRLLRSNFGEDHVELTDIMLMKGNLHATKKEVHIATKCYAEVVRILKVHLPEDHLSIANVYHNQGNVFSNSGQYLKAKECYEESLKITRKNLGDHNLDIADTLFSLGIVMRKMSEYKRAMKFLVQALKIRKDILGNGSTIAANTQHAMCTIHYLMGEHAVELTQETLLMKRSELGIDHLSVASTISLLGKMHKIKSEYDKALTCFEEVLRVRTLQLGPEHVDVAETYLDIALTKDLIGDTDSVTFYRQAERLYEGNICMHSSKFDSYMSERLNTFVSEDSNQRTFEENLKSYQEKHKFGSSVMVAQIICSLGIVYKELNKFEKAICCFNESLVLYNDTLSTDNLKIAELKFHLGCVLTKLRRFDEGLTNLNESLAIRNMKLNTNHIDVEDTLHQLGTLHIEMGTNDKAIIYFEKAMVAKKSRLKHKRIQKTDTVSLFRLGMLHEEKKEFNNAIECFEEVLRTQKSMLSNNDPEIARTLRVLGNIYREVQKPQKAFSRLKAALRIDLTHGKDTLDVANTLSCIGILHCEEERYDDAMKCYKEALRIRGGALGNHHIHVGQTLNNIGIVLQRSKQPNAAITYFKQALGILNSKLGGHHEEVGQTLHHLGNSYSHSENYEKALDCFIDAIQNEQTRLGKDNLKTADTHCIISEIYEKMNDIDKAISHAKKALEIRVKNLGSQHKDIGGTHHKIGKLMVKKGDQLTASSHFHDASMIMEALFKARNLEEKEFHIMLECLDQSIELLMHATGKDNIGVATLLTQKGYVLAESKRHEDALSCYNEAIRIQSLHLSSNDLNIANALHNIANILSETDDLEKAIKFYGRSLQITREILGEESLEYGDTMHFLGNAYRKNEQYGHAIECFRVSMKARRLHYGEDHTFVASTFFGLGLAYEKCKALNKAAECYVECLRIRRANMGADSLQVSVVLCNLGNVHKCRLDDVKALNCYEEALIIQRRKLGDDDVKVADTLLCLGVIHDTLHDDVKAMICYNAALRIFRMHVNGDKTIVLSAAKTIFNIGLNLDGQNRDHEAKESYLESLEMRKSVLGVNHEDVADVLCSLGTIYDKLGEHDQPIMKYYDRALDAYKQRAEKPGMDLKIAQVLHLKGIFIFKGGNNDEAMNCFNDALQIRVRELGQNHELVADTVFCMGNVFNSWNDTEKAFKCFDAAQFVHRKKYGISNLSVSNSLFYMGNIFETNNKYDEALKCYSDALMGRRRNLGDNHIDVANVLNRMGKVHKNKSHDDKALICFEECLRIRKFNLDDSHVEIAQTMLSVGTIYDAKKRFKKAQKHYDEALKIFESKGKQCILHVARTLAKIAGIYIEFDEDNKAIKCFHEAIHRYKDHLYPQNDVSENKEEIELNDLHKEYADLFYQLGYIHFKKENFRVAMHNYRESLKIYKALLGNDDLSVAKTVYSIALIHAKQKNYDKAQVFFQEALRIQLLFHGNFDVDVADTLFSIALVHEKKREYARSLKTLEECLTIRQTRSGKSSIEVALTLYNMGIIRGNLHEYKNAIAHWEDAIRIYKENGLDHFDEKIVSARKNIEVAGDHMNKMN